ncbi:MAG: hypothetical protein JXA14_23500 [Anaerolineae bacterium]|nr:hypothetical protein [Anaerolineae bacterium]
MPVDLTPTAYVYLPLVFGGQYTCPATSDNSYDYGIAFQYDPDNPVRPAHLHADKNLALRSYSSTDPPLRELVAYGTEYPQPPQFATLFQPHRVPPLVGFYRVHHWDWPTNSRGGPITDYPATALGLGTTPGEVLHVPESGYNIGGSPTMEVLVLFADEDSVTLRYTRDDSSAPQGYTLHIDNICTDPNLLALYNALDDYPDGPRYVFVPPENRPYGYDLPNLPAEKPLGTARGGEVVVAIADTGAFQDPRSCNAWWQIRPGYAGSCPPHE